MKTIGMIMVAMALCGCSDEPWRRYVDEANARLGPDEQIRPHHLGDAAPQTIETAPRDGSTIDICVDTRVFRWCDVHYWDGERWADADDPSSSLIGENDIMANGRTAKEGWTWTPAPGYEITPLVRN